MLELLTLSYWFGLIALSTYLSSEPFSSRHHIIFLHTCLKYFVLIIHKHSVDFDLVWAHYHTVRYS